MSSWMRVRTTLVRTQWLARMTMAWRFAVIAPLLGGAPVIALILWSDASRTLSNSTAGSVLVGALVLALVAGFVGAIPAAITGAIAFSFRQRWHAWRWCALVGVIGMLSTTGCYWLLLRPAFEWRPAALLWMINLAALGPASFVGGTLTARWLACVSAEQRGANPSGD